MGSGRRRVGAERSGEVESRRDVDADGLSEANGVGEAEGGVASARTKLWMASG